MRLNSLCLQTFLILISRFEQDLTNVLVVVTRYFGGIHLGADRYVKLLATPLILIHSLLICGTVRRSSSRLLTRFKHINQAARNALELGGFLEGNVRKGRDKGKGKR